MSSKPIGTLTEVPPPNLADIAVVVLEVGAKVTVDDPKFPGEWTVTKVNQRTVKLENALNMRLTADKGLCLPSDGTTTAPPANGRTLPHQFLGCFVRFTGRTQGSLTNGLLLVVIADKFDKVKVAKAGGDDDRYWNLPARLLEAVDASEVLR